MRTDPIIICGCPRSGTSITAAIFQKCGLWLGNILNKGHPDNPKGFYENTALRRANKELLKAGGYDERGVDPLPPVESMLTLPDHIDAFRRRIMDTLKQQRCPATARWGFKDPKALLTRLVWLKAFPGAKVIVVRRDAISTIRSCQNASFFKGRRIDWGPWVADQIGRCTYAAAQDSATTVWPGRLNLRDGWHSFRMAVEFTGLEWSPGAQDFFEAKLWNRGG